MDRQRPPRDTTQGTEAAIGEAWRDHRRHLLDIAFRMLGNLGEAEDAVQEAYARLVRADRQAIDDVGGWLVVVVSRLCIDRLRADRRHPAWPEDSIGDRPDPLPSPADRVTLDDTVRIGLHMVLERLTPAERTAFVLHDVFQYPFDAVADIVGRSPAACRQLASRARRAIRADTGRARFVVEPAEQRRVAESFIAACSTGNLDDLLALLDPAVEGGADLGGGRVVVTRGPQAVATEALRWFGPASAPTLLSIPVGGRPGVMAVREGRLAVVLTLKVRDGRIVHIDGVVDPAKLAPLAAILGA